MSSILVDSCLPIKIDLYAYLLLASCFRGNRSQYVGRSRKLWDLTMCAVTLFFVQKDFLPDINTARPAMRFLATSLNSNEINLDSESDVYRGALGAICAFKRTAEQGEPEHLQEMLDIGIVEVFVYHVEDLMQQYNENSSKVFIRLTACIAALIVRSNRDEHHQIFIDAGIVDISMQLLRNLTQEIDYSAQVREQVTSWIAVLMSKSNADEHRLAFIEAGIIEFLPNLMQDELGACQRHGCSIVMALSRCEDKSFAKLLWENGTVKLLFENASTDHSDDDLRPHAISALSCILLWFSDYDVKELVYYAYHRAVLDAVDRGLWDLQSPGVQDLWATAVARVRYLIFDA